MSNLSAFGRSTGISLKVLLYQWCKCMNILSRGMLHDPQNCFFIVNDEFACLKLSVALSVVQMSYLSCYEKWLSLHVWG